MRSDLIRIYKSVHTWTGIITGLALFIAFYAGALTVFKEPMARWLTPPGAGVTAVALTETPGLISRTIAADPAAARDFRLHLVAAEHLPARLSWQLRNAGADDHDQLAVEHYAATLATDGSLQAGAVEVTQMGEFIDVLHRVIGLPVDNDANRWLMGVVAALYALALISGVIVLLPSLVKDFFALRVGRNLKRMWLDAHNVVGIISLPFHLVMALTATVFAFHDGIYDLQDRILHGGKLETAFQGRPPVAPQATFDPAAMLAPEILLKRVEALSPDFQPHMLQYLQVTGPRPLVRVWGNDPAALSPRALGGFALLDPYTGRVVNTDYLSGQQDAPHTTVSSFFALHFATFGGAAVQWMYFFLGLAGAWLFYSGNLLWIETRRRKTAGATGQRRDVRLMAALTVGVCLGCICGISLSIVAGKWLHGHVADLNTWHRALYYAVFFSALAWSFVAGAARAAIHLLWLACATTAAIPLTSLLAVSLPELGLWAHGSIASLGIDLTALAGAIAFAWLALATARRAADGPINSVWSTAPAQTL